MGLFLKQQDNRSQLQERIAADLREKALKKAQLENEPKQIDVEDMTFLDGTKKTTGLAWAWALIFIMVVIAVVLLLLV